MEGQYAIVFHELGCQTGNESGSGGIEVGAAIAVAQQCVALGVTIAEKEVAGGFGEVEKRHFHFFGHLSHLPYVVHGMVIGRSLLGGLQTVGIYVVELVAQVVPTIATDVVGIEIHTAYWADEYRRATGLARLINIAPEILLVGVERCCPPIVHCPGCTIVTHVPIVGDERIAVGSTGFLIVVGKLDEHVVTGFHLSFHALSVSCLPIEALAAGTSFGPVVHRHSLQK